MLFFNYGHSAALFCRNTARQGSRDGKNVTFRVPKRRPRHDPPGGAGFLALWLPCGWLLVWDCWFFLCLCVIHIQTRAARTFYTAQPPPRPKIKKPKFPRQERVPDVTSYPTHYWVCPVAWWSVSWACGRVCLFLVCSHYNQYARLWLGRSSNVGLLVMRFPHTLAMAVAVTYSCLLTCFCFL